MSDKSNSKYDGVASMMQWLFIRAARYGKGARQEKGFTLIEVLMAMVILGIGIFAIVALQTRDMAFNNTSKHQAEGYTWAMAHVEWLKSLPFTDPSLTVQGSVNVVGDGHVASLGIAPAGTPYTFEWDVTAHPDFPSTNDARLVTVFVRWSNQTVAQVEFTKIKLVY
jgi:prepilin-type N-terminal cleavage/methylation domain-containing protein